MAAPTKAPVANKNADVNDEKARKRTRSLAALSMRILLYTLLQHS
jgi:hypothetical protein